MSMFVTMLKVVFTVSTSMPASNSASTSPQLRSLADWSFGEPKLADLPLDRLVIVHSFGRRGSNLFCIFSLICFQRWKNHSEQRTAGHFLLGHPHTMEGLLSTMSDLRFSTIAVAACVGELQQGGVGGDAQPGAWGGGDPGDHCHH